ncbi:AsmA family protein [Labilibacter marinus]|uniref:AsmA family protein n=1 Tax=Labilibacter marinus TaxID=1477105 RepID=UPI000832DF07|nr:AsmA-like C-terminal region-containing protein [Labilibacter marinus]
MKKRHLARNIFLIIGGFILLLIILAEIFKDEMIKLALEKGAKTFEVPLTVGEVDFSLVYNFPYATIEFNNLAMLCDSTQEPRDTIAGISKLYASVDVIQLMKGNVLVKEIEIEDVHAKYIVDSLGNSNFDFILEGMESDTVELNQDTTKVQGVFTLDQLQLSNIELTYIDESLKTSAEVLIENVEMNGELEPEGFKAATEGKVIVKSVQFQEYNLKVIGNTELSFDVTALNDTVRIQDFVMKTGTAAIQLSGEYAYGDSTYVDIEFSGEEIDIAENLSILPAQMLKEYHIIKAGGLAGIKGSAKGFVTTHTIPHVDVAIQLKEGQMKYDIYPTIDNITLEADYTNGYASTLKSSEVDIKTFSAKTGKSEVNLSGKIQNLEKIHYEFHTNVSANLLELLPYIPDSTIQELSGTITAKISSNGTILDSIDDKFIDYVLARTQMNLTMSDVHVKKDSVPEINQLGGTFIYQPNKIKISDFKVDVPEYGATVSNAFVKGNFKGKISDYERLALNLDSVSIQTPGSSVWASGKVNGLKNIKYDLRTALSLNLSEVKQMLPEDIANSMSGQVGAEISSAGEFNIESVADHAMPLLFESSQFSVSFKDVYLNMPDTIMNVIGLSGKVDYRNDSIWMDQVSGNYLGLSFSADSTSILNVYSAAIQNQKKQLTVNGHFGAGDLDYAWIEGFLGDSVPMNEAEMQAKIEEKENEEAYEQMFTTVINGKVKLASFKYGDIIAKNIDSKFLAKVDDGYYVADDLNCNVFGGNLKASVKYEMEHTKVDVPYLKDIMHFKIDAKGLDVSQLIGDLEEYIGQEDFQSKNVQGKLSGIIDGRVDLHDYNVIYEKMLLKGDIKLEDGALINVKPVMEVEEIAMIKLQNMDKLYFSTLESKMFLFKNKMYFPRTIIETSSFDAMFFGMYSFGEEYAYHIRMYLNQLLSKNDKDKLAKAAKDNGFVDEAVKDGKRPIYVVSSSKRTGLDKRNDRDRMDARVNLQKEMVEFRFDPNLVLYNTDK